MYCPNCGYEMGHELMCPSCGVDPVLFSKTTSVSDTLYNRGLDKAKQFDLSGAIESLNKSIEFNKNNTNSRNLLGLCYFSMGKIGDALKQWVISASILREDNLANDYLLLMQKESRKLEKFNDAVKMYNMALDYLKQKSDDMAVIQLKKAIEISPDFVDALNLLTLCSLIQKDKQKASELCEKVLSIDANNAIALAYYKELYPAKIRPESIQKVFKPSNFQNVIQKNPENGDVGHKKLFGTSFPLSEVLSFSVGLFVSFLLLFTLFLPGAVDEKDKEITTLKASYQSLQNEYNETKKQLQDQIDSLALENKRIEDEAEAVGRATTISEVTSKIDNAKQLSEQGNVVGSAGILDTIDQASLPDSTAQVVTQMKQDVYAKASQALYDQGIAQLNLKKYDEAKKLLEDAEKYSNADSNLADDIAYNLGVTYENLDDKASAVAYYQTVATQFPNSPNAEKAKQKVTQLS